jgi:ribonucleotide reductase class II
MSDFRASAPSAETVFLRTYSRRKADGSRENFQEAMLRTANDIAEIGKYTDEERALVEEQALAQHAFPSGRAFWVAGTEWGKKPENFSGYYNCLHRDTLVQTLDGLKRIEDLADGSTSTVLNGNGNWVDVEFKSYGEQTLVPVTFGQKGGATQVIRSTPNHRWITRRGEVTTAELRRGDKIAKIYSPKPDANLAGVRHGIIYGDGTTQYGEFFVDLVGEKAELAGYFEDVREYQHTRAYVKQEANFKRLPWLSDPSYLRGFFQGLIATDGSVTQSVVIYGNAELAAFVADKAALAGFAFVSSRVAARAGEKTNLGERKQDLWAIVLDKGSVSEEDLLRSSHKAKLRHGTERRWWTVKSIGAKEAPETVYCTEEPETHSFVLADGLLTGNCTSTHMVDLDAFGLMVDLAMQGSGTGAVLEQDVISQLPVVKNTLQIVGSSEIGTKPPEERQEFTTFESVLPSGLVELRVGDSRQGWRYAYQLLIKFAFVGMSHNAGHIRIHLDLSSVRPSGERLKGFGGTANPIKLEQAFRKAVDLLNGAHGRQLTSVEACLLIDEAATAIVAGNIRRSAGMRQFSETDLDAANAKDGLYMQDEEGNWKVDPKKEALRMANHTRCYHHTPEYQEIEDAVRKQFYSGEGAIQYVPEAVARSNADLLAPVEGGKEGFLRAYTRKGRERAKAFLQMCASELGYKMSERELNHRMDRYGLNPCGEILGRDFHCNLAEVHLNTLDPSDYDSQDKAFYAAGLQVAALLQHRFVHERYQYSREIDPIVGVSFTGLFDFFVHSMGSEWLSWMMDGRPEDGRRSKMFKQVEEYYLKRWRAAAHRGVKSYCETHGLRIPNRITTVQPAGTKSLLTGASSGWHPPKAARFIRRITLGKTDPLVPALLEYGFNIIPAQSARDDEGNLLDDINDPRVHEVLVEIPTEVSWANLPGCDQFDLNKLPIEAQFGLYMAVQQNYCDHNTSATLEIREHEIPVLAQLIHSAIVNNEGYISAAILARFDANETFPRLPFEPITKEVYDHQQMLVDVIREDSTESLLDLLNKYDSSDFDLESVSACTSASCIAKADKDERDGKG